VGTEAPLRDPGDYPSIHRRIKRLLEAGSFIITPYAQRRMAQRGIDLLDVLHILEHGSIVGRDRRGEQWRWCVQGGTVAGVTASCVVALEEQVIVVTVLDY
jgi:hypothetical protein